MNKHTNLTIIGVLVGFSVYMVVREVRRQDRIARFVNDYNGIVNESNNLMYNGNNFGQKREEREREERELAQWKETDEARNLEIDWTRKSKRLLLSDDVSIEMRPVSDILWFGKTEVTQAQWDAVMGDNPSRLKISDNPVENVSWDDCQEFLKKINALSSVKESALSFRLPTEEEWESACRAGAKGNYCRLPDGTEITKDTLGQVAWFEDNANNTIAVGQKKPNAFGLYDMQGNVREWTSTADGKPRVCRGGSWDDSARVCESSYRSSVWPSFRFEYIGFRLCAETEAGRKAREEREAAERKAREEREIAEQKAKEEARQTALAWKSESKIIPISSSVSIELQSVPGSLWFGKTEVTQAQWEAVMGENPSDIKGEGNPVDSVSWDDCQEFLKKLSACRAGATGDYCLLADGTEITESTLIEVAWFGEDVFASSSHPVEQKHPNAFGLYDMHGNVGEWTSTAVGERRVTRGGASCSSAGVCESSFGGWRRPSDRDHYTGFRLCAETEAGRKTREEREAAKEEARQTALAWKSESKIIPISSSVSIKLQSVPGPLWFGKTEVTQAQWEAVMGENPSYFKGESNPVDSVSWDDGQEFLQKLNATPPVKESGLTFRLPTEEEWESACRAGATGDYCRDADGTEIRKYGLGHVAWFNDNSKRKINPVGQKEPNAFGLYDMHGNICEWTSTADGEYRVNRGGSWDDSARVCESSHRSRNSPSSRSNDLGFRLCASGRAD